MLLIIPDRNLKQHKAELTAILRDRDTVQQSLEHISVHMINPFPDTGNFEFVNIATGVEAFKSKDLPHVKKRKQ